jgi:hypothetical protein
MATFRTLNMDRVLEVAAAPGTGNVALGGAVPGYRTFTGGGMTNGDTCAYFIEAVDATGTPTGPWERGFGTWNTGNTFSRSVIVESSGGLVNFTTAIRIGCAPMTDTVLFYPPPGGRLTAVSGAPVADTGIGGSGSIYYTPYLHDRIALWNGAGIQVIQFSQVTLNLATAGAAAGSVYDVYGYISGGALALETLVWANTSTRATNIAYLNGFICKSTDATRRYLGTFYASPANTVCDFPNGGSTSLGGKRFLWNMDNRVLKPFWVYDSTASWADPNTGSWQIYRKLAIPNNSVEFVRGISADAVYANAALTGACPAGAGFYSSIGLNGAAPTIPATAGQFYSGGAAGSSQTGCISSSFTQILAIGYFNLTLWELTSGGTVTFGSNSGIPGLNAIMPC